MILLCQISPLLFYNAMHPACQPFDQKYIGMSYRSSWIVKPQPFEKLHFKQYQYIFSGYRRYLYFLDPSPKLTSEQHWVFDGNEGLWVSQIELIQQKFIYFGQTSRVGHRTLTKSHSNSLTGACVWETVQNKIKTEKKPVKE